MNKPPIISKLESLASEVTTYQYLQRKKCFEKIELEPKTLEHMENMRICALRNVGVLRPLITDITGIENVRILQDGENKYSFDMWHSALWGGLYDKVCDHAISQCLDMISITVGAITDGINSGNRDPNTGKSIETASTRQDILIKPKAFISHGKGGGALLKLDKFLRELGVIPIIVKDQPSSDRTVDTKVQECLSEADFVIIFATGDNKVTDAKSKREIRQPRQNVIHEIGIAQETHPGKIIYLLEEKTEFPSNIKPKVYESFVRQNMDDAFTAIVREMRNWGFLKVGR